MKEPAARDRFRGMKAALSSLALLTVLSGCMVKPVQGTAPVEDYSYFVKSFSGLKSGEFPRRIKGLERAAVKEKSSGPRAKAHLQLAILYLHHRNPRADYMRALREFESYASLDPSGGECQEVKDWLSVLRALKKARRENGELREAEAKAQSEVERLKENIQRIQTIDIEVEKKRKQIR